MGARLINNSRRTKIGHVEDFPVLHMRSLRKTAMSSEGQRTEGHFRYPGASKPITIIVDLRSEHNLEETAPSGLKTASKEDPVSHRASQLTILASDRFAPDAAVRSAR